MGYERNDRSYGYGRDSRTDYGRADYGRGDYGRDSGDPRDRGFFDRAGDEVRSWFGDEEAERRRRMDERYDERYDNRSRHDEGGRYASNERGGYRSPERYPSWARSNGGSYSGGYAPTSYHYQRSDENRGFDDDYGYRSGAASYADTGYGYGNNQSRRNDEYRAALRGSAGYGSGGQGNRGRDDDQHGYHSWRNRQIDSFDRDYDEYRQENHHRFASEFAAWRQNRQTQRDSLTQAKEHQEVLGSDGTHVGKVDHIRGDRILLTKTDRDAGGHHHSIPSSWINKVDDKVHLSKTTAEAQQAWRDEENNQGLFGGRDREDGDRGTTNLNRSFSGTY